MNVIRRLLLMFIMRQPAATVVYRDGYILAFEGVNSLYIDSVMCLVVLDRDSSYLRQHTARLPWSIRRGRFFGCINTPAGLWKDVLSLVSSTPVLEKGTNEMTPHFYDEKEMYANSGRHVS